MSHTTMGSGTAEAFDPDRFRESANAIEAQVQRVIVGQREAIRGVLLCLIAGGHALLEGIPGVGWHPIQSSGLSVVLYMTELDHDGSKLLAEIHGGAFVAPRTGTFKLTSLHNGTIVGTLSAKHMAERTLTFNRFSKKPQP